MSRIATPYKRCALQSSFGQRFPLPASDQMYASVFHPQNGHVMNTVDRPCSLTPGLMKSALRSASWAGIFFSFILFFL